MALGKRWSRDELIIAMNLYCKLPFGQLDHRTPIIIEVSQKLGRTPSSLSMKLCNFASLDPVLQARGIQGLRGASQADREIWQEFYTNWEELGAESEERFQALFENTISEDHQLPTQRKSQTVRSIKIPRSQPTGSTEAEVTVKARIGQNFFRQTVLANDDSRCCITGNPIPELLIASHILPWGSYPEHRLNPHNGLCLSRTQDAAFDNGMITFDEDYRLVLSAYLESFLPEETLERNFVAYRGQQMRLPEKFQPAPDFLRRHREEIFLGN
ncbi:HNH endonuclease [Iningainema tapete]|uniref:HNH endonuclease n=1 Tax=Iningainema tapete BLCC-T55 TaxID=2748662 RepID=A0A8J7C0A2_9CYAN|nr:HNH endonuclease [Iningainema tapete]MBD2777663.1 HNH endonuclease [Iningainema tapete BLCC-T55]